MHRSLCRRFCRARQCPPRRHCATRRQPRHDSGRAATCIVDTSALWKRNKHPATSTRGRRRAGSGLGSLDRVLALFNPDRRTDRDRGRELVRCRVTYCLVQVVRDERSDRRRRLVLVVLCPTTFRVARTLARAHPARRPRRRSRSCASSHRGTPSDRSSTRTRVPLLQRVARALRRPARLLGRAPGEEAPEAGCRSPGSLRRRRRGGARRRAGRRRDSKRAARGRRDGGQGRRSPRRCRLGNTGPGCLRGRRPRPRTDGVLVPFADPAPPQRRHGRAIGPSRPPQGPRKLCRRRVRRQAAPLVAPVQGRLVNPDREEGPLHADAVRGDAQVRRR